jgi:hypothetical protein
MADAMLAEAGCRDLLAESIAEAVTAKRAAHSFGKNVSDVSGLGHASRAARLGAVRRPM